VQIYLPNHLVRVSALVKRVQTCKRHRESRWPWPNKHTPSPSTFLSIELWREVIHHAASIEDEFKTCSFDGRDYTFDCAASYRAEWRQGFRTRLSLILVCKLWSNLASEYLYRSILVTNYHTAQEFVQLVPRLIYNGMIRHVRRVSVHHTIPALPPLITQFHNLHVLQVHTYLPFRPEMIQAHITTLYVTFDGWPAFETLASLPHLQYLRFSLVTYVPINSRIKLSQLRTLHVKTYVDFHSFYEWFDVPNLHTLILDYTCTTARLPLIQHFLPHVRALGLHNPWRTAPSK